MTRPVRWTAPFDEATARAAQDAWAKHLGKPEPGREEPIAMELELIPPGKFTMGSPAAEKDRSGNEGQVDVTLTNAFYLERDDHPRPMA